MWIFMFQNKEIHFFCIAWHWILQVEKQKLLRMNITHVIFALVLVGISDKWCGDRAGEDAAHPAGSVRHQQ